MSKSFTTPAGQTWQTLLTELTLAYSERRQAIGQSAYVPEDRDVQPAAYWAGLQSWLEGIVSYGWNPGAFPLSKVFIDHVNGPLTDAGDDFVVYTLDNWRAAAGLHQDGFRRSVDGATFSYGRMQSGDAIGGWIFEDLQKGFGALQMVGDVATAATETKYGYAVTYDCVSALAASLIDWAAKPWRETDA